MLQRSSRRKHVRWRSKGGPTILDNLILRCRFHHRLVHEYGYQLGRGPDGEVRFYDVQGRQLYDRSAVVDSAAPRDLSLVNAEEGVTVTPTTISPRWEGDSLDLAFAVSLVVKPDRPYGHAQPERPRGDARSRPPEPHHLN
jgi:hypothetical protein